MVQDFLHPQYGAKYAQPGISFTKPLSKPCIRLISDTLAPTAFAAEALPPRLLHSDGSKWAKNVRIRLGRCMGLVLDWGPLGVLITI